MESVDPNKYATFKRDDLISVTDGYVTFKTTDELPDAVVIRRQDYFAAPALNAYANSIAIAAKLVPKLQAEDLIRIADYFHQQAELAAEEGWKTPD